jgi:hypothetical protein
VRASHLLRGGSLKSSKDRVKADGYKGYELVTGKTQLFFNQNSMKVAFQWKNILHFPLSLN